MTSLPDALPGGTVRLDDWGVIRARGADARSFLHGQLTQDVLHLEPARARLAGYCSAKGRLLASFVMWADGPEDVLLACSADLLPAVLKRLSMFVLRSRCKLTDDSAACPLWGLAGAAAQQAVPGLATAVPPLGVVPMPGAMAVRLHDASIDGRAVPRALWVGPPPPASSEVLDAEAWRWLEVRSGVARIVAATVEQFVPQMVNLELVGGVNFQKGCYPGQEVVARSQYRGTLKRRSQIVTASVALQPGQEVFDQDDPEQPAGRVVLAGTHAGQHAALVELKLASTVPDRLHAGASDGPLLTLAALPYAIPAEAA